MAGDEGLTGSELYCLLHSVTQDPPHALAGAGGRCTTPVVTAPAAPAGFPKLDPRKSMLLTVASRAPSLVRLAAIATGALIIAAPLAPALAQDGPPRPLDVPFVPTPEHVVDAMLKISGVSRRDFLLDLGSGDGRIPVTAAKRFGTRGVGVDLNPVRVREAKANAEKNKVTNLVTFFQGDLFEMDLSRASVISMYLLPSVNMKLRPFVLNLRPGTRIVSHDFDMGDWKADRTEKLDYKTVYFWIVPAKVAGRYQLRAGKETIELALEQKYQEVSGTATVGGKQVPVSNGKITGDFVTFEFPGADGKPRKFEGRATDLGRITGRGWTAQRV